MYFSFPTVTCSAFKQGVTRSWPEATYVVVRYIILRERVDRTDATMAGTVSLPFLGRPTVRVRRVPNVERLQVVLQDVFVHLGGVSSANAAKRIRTAREKIGRDVVIHQVREGANTLLATTLTDAVDLLIEVDVPAARQLRHQLIQLGKLVVGGDPDGTVATEIQANKKLLHAMEPQERSLFKELMLPDDFKHSMQVHVLAVVFLPASCCYSDSHNPLVLQATRVTVVNRIPIKEDRKGVVYAVTSPLLNAIKIGHWNASTHSLDAQCRKFYGHDIQMITATTSTPKRLEEHLHRQVAEHHLSGSLYDKSMVDAIFRTVRNPE